MRRNRNTKNNNIIQKNGGRMSHIRFKWIKKFEKL